MADEPPQEHKPRNWLTLSVLGAAGGIALYVFTIGNEIGGMRQKLDNNELRITALETHGSGPVQTAAAKVDAVIARADRILTELLAMQQRIADIQATQQAQAGAIARLQQDMTTRRQLPDPPTNGER
jgi:hypothetical protein